MRETHHGKLYGCIHEIQRYRDTDTDTVIQRYRDTEIQRYRYREGESKTDKERPVKRQRDIN